MTQLSHIRVSPFVILLSLVFTHCDVPPPQQSNQIESASGLLYGQTEGIQTAALNALRERLPEDAAPLEYQVFRYMAAEPKSMDQGVSIYVAGGSEFLFERLAMFGLNGELVPGAADSWTASEDGREWTFHLRQSGRWSDGRPVTAHDFEFTFKRFLHPDAGNVYAFL